jgi:hypothetical protein
MTMPVSSPTAGSISSAAPASSSLTQRQRAVARPGPCAGRAWIGASAACTSPGAWVPQSAATPSSSAGCATSRARGRLRSRLPVEPRCVSCSGSSSHEPRTRHSALAPAEAVGVTIPPALFAKDEELFRYSGSACSCVTAVVDTEGGDHGSPWNRQQWIRPDEGNAQDPCPAPISSGRQEGVVGLLGCRDRRAGDKPERQNADHDQG